MCVVPAECKSRAKEWGRVILLSAFSFRGLQGVWCLGCWKCLRFLCYPLVVCDKSCWIAVIAQLWQTTVCVFEWLCCSTSRCYRASGRVLWLVVCAEWVICRPGSNPCACEALDWMTMVAYRRYNVWYLTLLTILKEINNCLVVFSLWKLTKNFFITHERMSRCWTVGNAFWKAQKSQYSCQCLTRELAGAQKNAAESCTALLHSYLEPICFSFSAM